MKRIDRKRLPDCFNVAIIATKLNVEITEGLLKAAETRLRDLGFEEEQITLVWVPSHLEVPVTVQRLAKSDQFEAMIVLGGVSKSELTLCQSVNEVCQEVALSEDIPVIWNVIEEEEADSNAHLGADAVDAAYDLVSVLHQI